MKQKKLSDWRTYAATFAVCFLFVGSAWAQSLAVVELFTSQGCNSCPPADELLGELAERDDVLALSFNVDYWDYIGWKDTLASPQNTDRQKGYAYAMRSNRIYTPQMVIGGRQHVVGSNRRSVMRAIEQLQNTDAPQVDINLTDKGDRVQVTISGPDSIDSATIWLLQYDRNHVVAIQRGENRGRTISYHNAVRDYDSLGMFTGRPLEIVLSKQRLMNGGRDACAIIVQQDRQGPILGAARMEWASAQR